MAVSSASSSWSDLPPELLERIFDDLNDSKDLLRSMFVCSSWRQSAKWEYHRMSIPVLWISNRHNNLHEEDKIINLFDNPFLEESNSLGFLEDGRGNYWTCGFTNGFLLTVGVSFPYEVHLLNPFSKTLISLPPLISFEYVRWVRSQERFSVSEILKGYVKKAVVSTNPSDPDCVVVLIIYAVDRKLAFCRCGDKNWTDLESENGNFSFDDIVFCNGVFYAIDTKGKILYCDLGPNPRAVSFGGTTLFHYEPGGKFFAESVLGDLWVVLKKLDYEDSGDFSISFEIYEFDSDVNEWKKVRSLKGKALFLCPNGESMAVFAGNSGLGGYIEGNSVYFIGDSIGNFVNFGGSANQSIFKWESKQIKKLYQTSSWSYQMFWIKYSHVCSNLS